MPLDNNTIDNFLNKSSWIGLLTLYYSKLMFDKKAAFTKQDLEKIRSGEYCYGFLVACSAFSLLSITSSGNILNITSYNEYLMGKVHNKLLSSASDYEQKGVNIDWRNDISRIENLSNNPVTV